VEWLAAWDTENADGGLILWVDGEESGYIPWIDNDTQRVDTVRLGVLAVGSASTSGTLYLDDFVSHKSEYIGLNEQQRSSMQEQEMRALPASSARSQALRLPSTPARAPVQPLRVSSGEVSRTIDYTYDGLHRLTGATYDNGDYYAYSYDAVGNRLVLDSDVNGTPVYLEYTYDHANRLAAVGEVEYEWDDNGNLLDDGVNTYSYDSANRLLTVSGESLAESFGYNGLGRTKRLECDMIRHPKTIFYGTQLAFGLSGKRSPTLAASSWIDGRYA
jgi:YD repeat-containing protein